MHINSIVMEIEQDDLYKQFLRSRELKSPSIDRYKRDFTMYSNFIDKMPTEWITEAEEEEKKGILMRNRKITEYLLDFKDHLLTSKKSSSGSTNALGSTSYAPNTIINTITNVRSFYHQFNIQLPNMKLKVPTNKETIEDIPTFEDIKLALNYANVKYKAIIKLMLSSGMRGSDIRALKYKNFLVSLMDYINIPKNTFIEIDDVVNLLNKTDPNEIKVPTWHFISVKNNIPTVTFSSPESLNDIILYLEKCPPKTLESPLFKPVCKKDRPISKSAFQKYFEYLNDKCDFGKSDTGVIFFHAHIFRKLFSSILYSKGIQKLTIDWLTSHSVEKVTESYFKSDISSIKKLYIDCVEALSIEAMNLKTLKTPDVIKIEEKLNEQTQENKAMREEMEELKRAIETVRYIEQK